MTAQITSPVLILGGTGLVGTQTVKILRKLYPDLPIAIASRNKDKGQALATEVGNAVAVEADVAQAGLGLAEGASYSAVVALLKENTLNPLRYAQANGLPYISMADGAFEIGPAVARYMYKPESAPVMLAGHWVVGMTAMPILHFAAEFRKIDSIRAAVIMDPNDPIGPMAQYDVELVVQNSPRPLILDNGTWRWADEACAARRVRNAAGEEVEVFAMSVLDTISLAAATDARSVRLDFGTAETSGGGSGEGPSHEMILEISGETKDGKTENLRIDIDAPQGVTGLTALGVALSIERLLGLAGGAPVAPGLYFPENLIDPAHAIARLTEFGGQIRRA